MTIEKIVSDVQTGAGRAALDWAIFSNIHHGSWCPAGRKAEDGTIPLHYAPEKLADGGYRRHTKANVRDSDATLIVSIKSELTGGSRETAQLAERLANPGCMFILDRTGNIPSVSLCE